MIFLITSCARGDRICLRPCKLTISLHLFARLHLFRHVGYLKYISKKSIFDLLTLKVVSKWRVTWATCVSILVFLGPLFSTLARCTRQTSDRQALWARRHNNRISIALEKFGYYAPAEAALSDDARLTWHCVCLTSVAYIGPKSRTERHRKT